MAKAVITLLWLLTIYQYAHAQLEEQELSREAQQLLENETAATTGTSEDDEQWQQLAYRQKQRLSLNAADIQDLTALGVLSPLQVESLLQYRKLLGDLVSIYELQAVPGFDMALIKKLLPYVKVGDDLQAHYSLKDLFRKGEQSVLLRYSRQLELSSGYEPKDIAPPSYKGSPGRMFIRYRYNFSQHLSYGVTMEKDAGEGLFSGAQQTGFDFYSAHLFVTNYKGIRYLALGDYAVNLGQGLIQWHSQAGGKGGAVLQVKREGSVLRPYTSAGEYYFFRGGGVTTRIHKLDITAFTSLRKLDGTLAVTDTIEDEMIATAIAASGYHRTAAEVAKKGQLTQFTNGLSCKWNGNWQPAVNMILHQFSPPIQKEMKPYNQFDFRGKQLMNVSADYAGTFRNIHLFGEVATDMLGNLAMMQGVLMSAGSQADISIVYRNYSKQYQSLYSKGFGDSYKTMNEEGIYLGGSLKLSRRWTLDGYADFFRFPWLKYGVDYPSGGTAFLTQLTFLARKDYQYQLRIKLNTKYPNLQRAKSIRCHAERSWNKQLSTAVRIEYNLMAATETALQRGCLTYLDLTYRCKQFPFQISGRCTWFYTDSYQSRLYAYESSVLYDNSVGQYYGKGWQYYLNMKYKIRKNWSVWAKCSQVYYPDVTSIGSGLDKIYGNKKSALQLQTMLSF
ncbi:Helix-hairpin-helix motif-containing protein [Chitinophaga jiangningensis]|uniref:Helix-hairpin-helix motif-containing protein n=1 Tax=Chitinophaga jiangningensis TaxID=1419482 RepID=A0A1M7FUV3_9BACT|nr:helix-hairpin-helix domain-containing protein [Chitinophaga jiangningensis]SHM07786.1 Helix-hairpin-helix motif-containing protein [Chitinophaga jiangningensis]